MPDTRAKLTLISRCERVHLEDTKVISDKNVNHATGKMRKVGQYFSREANENRPVLINYSFLKKIATMIIISRNYPRGIFSD